MNAIIVAMRRAVIACLLLVSCGRVPSEHPAARPVRIGMFTGVTGPTAAWGTALERGAQLAADDANAAGVHVELVVEDDQGRPELSTNAALKLINGDPPVVALIGGDTSSRTLAAAPVAERAHVPMVSPTASAPQVTIGKRFVFRVCPTDDQEAVMASQLAATALGARRVAILRDIRNDYSTGMTRTFASDFAARGGTISGTFDYSEGDSDYRAQLTAARATNPDVLFLPGYYGDVAQIAAQARDLGITTPLLGGSGWDSPKLTEIGGKAVEGGRFVGWTRSRSRDFVTRFHAKYGSDPDAASALAYDAVALVCDAIRRAGTNATPQQIRDAIGATRNFAGVSGTITIEPSGNARKPLAVFRVVNGKFVDESRGAEPLSD